MDLVVVVIVFMLGGLGLCWYGLRGLKSSPNWFADGKRDTIARDLINGPGGTPNVDNLKARALMLGLYDLDVMLDPTQPYPDMKNPADRERAAGEILEYLRGEIVDDDDGYLD